jgi:hypothetical protein
MRYPQMFYTQTILFLPLVCCMYVYSRGGPQTAPAPRPSMIYCVTVNVECIIGQCVNSLQCHECNCIKIQTSSNVICTRHLTYIFKQVCGIARWTLLTDNGGPLFAMFHDTENDELLRLQPKQGNLAKRPNHQEEEAYSSLFSNLEACTFC